MSGVYTAITINSRIYGFNTLDMLSTQYFGCSYCGYCSACTRSFVLLILPVLAECGSSRQYCNTLSTGSSEHEKYSMLIYSSMTCTGST